MGLLPYTYRYTELISIDRSTGEEKSYHFPMVPCHFGMRNKKIGPLRGLLDSGSIGIVIPMDIASILELVLQNDSPMSVVGTSVERQVGKADLVLGSQGRFTTIGDAEVSVPLMRNNTPVILGRRPIFELYDITFVEADLKFIMKPHGLKKK